MYVPLAEGTAFSHLKHLVIITKAVSGTLEIGPIINCQNFTDHGRRTTGAAAHFLCSQWTDGPWLPKNGL